MKKNIYLCVDVTTYTEEVLRTNEGRDGRLTMTEEGERFVFAEMSGRKRKRNPQVWKGQHLNIGQTERGEYVVNLHRTLLSELDPLTFADEVYLELERAQTDLKIRHYLPKSPSGAR